MEQDILDELYYGHIVPWENQNDKTPEMELFSEQVDQDIECLEKLLDAEGKKCWSGFWITVQSWNACRFARALRTDFGLGCSL